MKKMSSILKKQGIAKNKPDSDFDKNELTKGIKIEYEHIDKAKYSKKEAKEIAKEIAKDHLAEIPDYYTRLIKMEKDAETNENKISLKQFLRMNEDDDKGTSKLPKDIEEKVKEFLRKNPNPNDDKVHSFAKELGVNTHKLEAIFYKLATETV